MTNDNIKDNKEVVRIQQETLKNLEEYNKKRKTEIVNDLDNTLLMDEIILKRVNDGEFIEDVASDFGVSEKYVSDLLEDESDQGILDAFERSERGTTIPPMQEWLDAQERLNKDRGVTVNYDLEPSGWCEDCNGEGVNFTLDSFGVEHPSDCVKCNGTGITPTKENIPEPEEKLIMSHICPYCGTMAYMGQIHGLGYCKEKVQYEQ